MMIFEPPVFSCRFLKHTEENPVTITFQKVSFGFSQRRYDLQRRIELNDHSGGKEWKSNGTGT